MFEWLRRLFRRPSQTPPPLPPPPAPRPEPKAPEAPLLELHRYSEGKADVLGRLSFRGEQIAFTLESAPGKLPPGDYPLSLHAGGGREAAYRFRFPAFHKGMIRVGAEGPACLVFSNTVRGLGSSIALGQQPQREQETQAPRELWFSEQAYKSVYQQIAPELVAGKSLSLRIR
jgi:hypothetical protein